MPLLCLALKSLFKMFHLSCKQFSILRKAFLLGEGLSLIVSPLEKGLHTSFFTVCFSLYHYLVTAYNLELIVGLRKQFKLFGTVNQAFVVHNLIHVAVFWTKKLK